jgi:hypothetical protein
LLSEANVLRELQLGLGCVLPEFAAQKDPDRWMLRQALRKLREPARIAIRSPAVSGEWKSNQGTKSDRELRVRGDPWAVSARRVRPRLTELFSKIATQAAELLKSGRPAGRARLGEGRVEDRLEPTSILD